MTWISLKPLPPTTTAGASNPGQGFWFARNTVLPIWAGVWSTRHEDIHEFIACHCETCAGLKEPHFFNYKTLLTLYAKGINHHACEQAYAPVDIVRILDPIVPGGKDTLYEIREGISRIEHQTMKTGNGLENLKKWFSGKVGWGIFKVDVLEILDMITKKRHEG